jgi:hypothetical protein
MFGYPDGVHIVDVMMEHRVGILPCISLLLRRFVLVIADAATQGIAPGNVEIGGAALLALSR